MAEIRQCGKEAALLKEAGLTVAQAAPKPAVDMTPQDDEENSSQEK